MNRFSAIHMMAIQLASDTKLYNLLGHVREIIARGKGCGCMTQQPRTCLLLCLLDPWLELSKCDLLLVLLVHLSFCHAEQLYGVYRGLIHRRLRHSC